MDARESVMFKNIEGLELLDRDEMEDNGIEDEECTDDEEINTDQDVEALSGDSPMEVVSSWPFNE